MLDLGGVPLKTRKPLVNSIEEHTRGPLFGQLHIHDADLGCVGRTHAAAQGLGQQLMSKAEPQIRHAFSFNRLTNIAFFLAKPWVRFLLPDVHRPTQNPKSVITVDGRKGFSSVEFDGIIGMTIFLQELTEDPGMFDGGVLEHEDFHGRCVLRISVSQR